MSMPSAGILELVSERLTVLRRSEQKVAHTVLADPAGVLKMTVADLARAAEVSEPTVIRFATALGCDGFPDFKLHLAQSLALGIPATHSVITPDDDVAATVSKVFDYSVTSLDHARRRLDVERVGEAVDALAQARHVVFLGLGASGIVALDAEQKFPLFGVPCSAPIDSHQQFLSASMAGEGTVVVAISNVGRTTSILDAVRIARRGGATTIGLSGGQTPLLALCDIPIVVEALDNTDVYTPSISRLAQLVVIDVLATSVALRRDDRDRLRKMKRQLTRLRTAPGPDFGAEELP